MTAGLAVGNVSFWGDCYNVGQALQEVIHHDDKDTIETNEQSSGGRIWTNPATPWVGSFPRGKSPALSLTKNWMISKTKRVGGR
jgi:hypothetical protein